MNGSTKESNLTKRQQLMWIEHELNSDDSANNMIMTFTISGKLDPFRFRDAFELVAMKAWFYRYLTLMIPDNSGWILTLTKEYLIKHPLTARQPNASRFSILLSRMQVSTSMRFRCRLPHSCRQKWKPCSSSIPGLHYVQ